MQIVAEMKAFLEERLVWAAPGLLIKDVTALKNGIRYHYTVISASDDWIDHMPEFAHKGLKNFCLSDEKNFFREAGAVLEHYYYDQNDVLQYKFSVCVDKCGI